MPADTRTPASRRLVLGAALALPLGWAAVANRGARASDAVALPPPATDLPTTQPQATAVLAGGCFWGVQAVFQHTRGVLAAISGYAGGSRATADYAAVSAGRTQHAEAVRIIYDPRVVSYGQLLQVFFSVAHDPTQRDRQGPDVGPQYRSAVFAQDAAQLDVATRYVAQLEAARVFAQPIATQLLPAGAAFYPAEAYHQDFAARNPRHPYIVAHDAPKLVQLQRLLPERWRAEPVLGAKTA